MAADWTNKLQSFLGGITDVADTLVSNNLYPRGFDQQDPVYQRVWLDHHILELEQQVARLEAKTQSSAAVAAAQAPQPNLADVFSGKVQVTFAEMNLRLRGSGEQLELAVAKEQLIAMKARQASLMALLPAATQSPKITSQQQRAQKLAEAAALEAERDKVAPTISDLNFRQAYINSMDHKIQQIYTSI